MRKVLLTVIILLFVQACRTFPAVSAQEAAQYPLAVATTDGELFVVDLNLPGVWKVVKPGSQPELFFRGTKRLRQPMNRPRCIAVHPDGGVLVGDSASRDIYHLEANRAILDDEFDKSTGAQDPKKGLTDAHIGVPMCLLVSADRKSIYVGDAEKRSILSVPIDGGKVSVVAKVNARALVQLDDQTLLAATPDPDAVVKVDIKNGEVTTVITGQPYQYVNGMVFDGEQGYVSDIYGKTIWSFDLEGNTEPWIEGEPLVGPVAMAINSESVFVADPKVRKVFQFNRDDKSVIEWDLGKP